MALSRRIRNCSGYKKPNLRYYVITLGFLQNTKEQIISELLWKELSLYLHWQVLQSSRCRCTVKNSLCWGPNIQSICEVLCHTSSSLFLWTECLLLVKVHEMDTCSTSFRGVSSHTNLICSSEGALRSEQKHNMWAQLRGSHWCVSQGVCPGGQEGQQHPGSHRIIESLRLEKTSNIMKTNRQLKTTMLAKSCPDVPYLHVFWTPPGMWTPPLPSAACSNASPLFQ